MDCVVYYRDSIRVSFGALEPCLELGQIGWRSRYREVQGDAGESDSAQYKASRKFNKAEYSIAHIAVLVELVP